MPLAQGAEFRAVCRELTLNSKIWTSKLPTPENRKLVFQSPDLAPPFVLACFRHRPNRSGGRLFSLADLVCKDINFNQCVVPGWSLHAGQRRCIDGVYRHYGRQNLAQPGLTLNNLNSKKPKKNAPDLIAEGLRRLTPEQRTPVYAEGLVSIPAWFLADHGFVSWFVS